MDLATPAATARTLRAFGLRPRKRWGQHFLVSRKALDLILGSAELGPQDIVLEIGAGLGALTVALAEVAGFVVAVEIDAALLPALRAATDGFSNIVIVCGDVMRLDAAALRSRAPHVDALGPTKVVANLPYNVASPLIVRLLEHPAGIRRMVLTVQREVAHRLVAPPGGKDYGALSLAVQYRAEASIVGRIPATAFYPPPDVDSAVVRLDLLDRPRVRVADEAVFFRIIRAAFGQRRKMLRNALAAGLSTTAAEAERACVGAGLDFHRRGETLSLEEFAALAGALEATGLGPRASGANPV